MQNNLQQIRKRAGLNQEQLGQIIGVTKGHVSKIESGQVGLNETSKRGLKLSREEFLKLSVDLYNYVQKHRTENEKIEVNTALAELFMNTKANAAS